MRTPFLLLGPSLKALTLILLASVAVVPTAAQNDRDEMSPYRRAASQAEADSKIRAIAAEILDAQNTLKHGKRHAIQGQSPHAPNALKAYLFDVYDQCDPGKKSFIRQIGRDIDFNRSVIKALRSSTWPSWSGDARDEEQLVIILSESSNSECKSPYVVVAARSVGLRPMREGFIASEDIDPFIRAVRSELNSAYYDGVFWETNTTARLGIALSERPVGPRRPRSIWVFVSPSMASRAANIPAIVDVPTNVLRPVHNGSGLTFEVLNLKNLSSLRSSSH